MWKPDTDQPGSKHVRNCIEPQGRAWWWLPVGSGCDPKQAGNEGSSCRHVSTADGADLPLPDHRNCLITRQCSPGYL